MSKENKFLDDMAKLFETTVSTAIHAKDEAANSLKSLVENIVQKMHLVKKDELDALRKVVQKNHAEIQALRKELGLDAVATKPKAKAHNVKSEK